MKKILLAAISFLLVNQVDAQTFQYVTESEYTNLKTNGLLTGNEVIQSPDMVTVNKDDIYVEYFFTPKAQGCGGYFDPPGVALQTTALDDGWLVASPLALPFTFCFFGDSYSQVWMNNNGNISFTGGISTYSSNAFPSTGNVMIAPFWADFDLGGTGTMHATITPTAAIFNWVEAGYFSSQVDKINTCQVVITDGTDPLVIGGNAAIHYSDMQWTTGSASSGVNGFGGVPATAGANRGNNIDYFQIGQFDHEGIDYDGPNGAVDGVSWLDDKSFFFDFCTAASGNIEPIPLQTAYCDTFQVCSIGDTLDISFPFLSPENIQTTAVTLSAPTLNNVYIVSNNPGSIGEISIQIYGSQEPIGVHEITVTATDDFVPAGVTTISYWVEVVDGALQFLVDPVLDYTVQCAPVVFSVLNGPYDAYQWETGGTYDTTIINNFFNDTLTVIVEKNGCKFQIDSLVNIPNGPIFNLTGALDYCAGSGGTFLEVDSLNMNSISWGLANPALDTLFSNTLMAGVYTITASDTSGACFDDTTFTIIETSAPVIDIQGNLEYCSNTSGAFMEILDSTSMQSITWGLTDPEIDTMYSNSLLTGTYTISALYISDCPSDTTITITQLTDPSIFNNDVGCNNSFSVTGTTSIAGGVWTSTDPAISFLPSANVENPQVVTTTPGVYTITYTDNFCQIVQTAQIDFPPYPTTELFDTTLCNGVLYELIAPNTNNYQTTYEWNTGQMGEMILISEAGAYTVTLSNVCHSSQSSVVIDYKLCDIVVPNVISIALGSQNPLWYVEADGLAGFNLVITNRWGNVVYSCSDAEAKCYWDGTSQNGSFVEEGTYFYSIDATLNGGQTLQKQGFIEVVD